MRQRLIEFRISIHALLAESDVGAIGQLQCILDFYPRSPCGERLCGRWMALSRLSFLSTLSLRRATCVCWLSLIALPISIHALLAESDDANLGRHSRDNNFYPRSPCGERQHINSRTDHIKRFLSTLSLRRATMQIVVVIVYALISIHALLAESDVRGEHHANSQQEFLSTLSLRRATRTL